MYNKHYRNQEIIVKKISYKNYIVFGLIILFAVAAFSVILYQGLKPFLVSKNFSWIGSSAIIKTGEKARSLDGVYLSEGESEQYPVAVVIDNKYEARPWSGLSYAGIIFEAPVEGGITRFLAIYSSSREIKKIGPVRSIRPYYLDWVSGYGALFTHIGGSPAAMDEIANDAELQSRNVDGYYTNDYFWRASDRIAPHNSYTSSTLLEKARTKLAASNINFSPWKFKSDNFSSERGNEKEIKIQFSIYSIYDAIWEYDKEKNIYMRKTSNNYAHDDDNALILAKNIAVLETDIEIIDAVSRREIRTTGSGNALVFQDGKKIEGIWEKKDSLAMLRFYDKNGKEIEFNRGTTWVEVVSSLDAVKDK